MVPPVEHVPWLLRSPYTLSVRSVSVTGSVDTELFFTDTVKVVAWPGSFWEAGAADLVTLMAGGALVRTTVACAESWAVVFSSSLTFAVTVSVWLFPALPDTSPVNVHVY